jgi:hypothetical protein
MRRYRRVLLWFGGATALCDQSWHTFEQSVQDSRKWTDADLPGVGDYLKARWQGKAMSDPCSRSDRLAYQGVIFST